MPHLRNRHILPILTKKLKFSPIVALQGARQTGKSFLAREILPQKLKESQYVTLDQGVPREFALSNPESFLSQYEKSPLIIDEAQKAPPLFDAIKFNVDQRRRPGMYFLLGSTEFSKLTQIRESLTGRISRARLFPLTLAETRELPLHKGSVAGLINDTPRFKREHLMKYLKFGGMPAIFSVSNENERDELMQDWLRLTLDRDVHLFRNVKINSELCEKILQNIVSLDEPTAGNIAKKLHTDPRRIKTHLLVLETLFVIHKINPCEGSSGKALYYICDVGLATRLGADFVRQLHTYLLNELTSHLVYKDLIDHKIYFYRNLRGNYLQFVIRNREETVAVKILTQEKIDMRELELLKSFGKKYQKGGSVKLVILGSMRMSLKKEKIEIYPWESVS